MIMYSYGLVALAGLAAAHYVYEQIIAPDIRLWQWVKLKKLERELSKLCAEPPLDLPKDSVEMLRESIHLQLGKQYLYTISLMVRAELRHKRDSEFKKSVDHRIRTLDKCTSIEFAEIRRKVARQCTEAIAINSGFLLCWFVVPVIFVSILTYLIRLSFLPYLKLVISRVEVMKSREIDRLGLVIPAPILGSC